MTYICHRLMQLKLPQIEPGAVEDSPRYAGSALFANLANLARFKTISLKEVKGDAGSR